MAIIHKWGAFYWDEDSSERLNELSRRVDSTAAAAAEGKGNTKLISCQAAAAAAAAAAAIRPKTHFLADEISRKERRRK